MEITQLVTALCKFADAAERRGEAALESGFDKRAAIMFEASEAADKLGLLLGEIAADEGQLVLVWGGSRG